MPQFESLASEQFGGNRRKQPSATKWQVVKVTSTQPARQLGVLEGFLPVREAGSLDQAQQSPLGIVIKDGRPGGLQRTVPSCSMEGGADMKPGERGRQRHAQRQGEDEGARGGKDRQHELAAAP